MCSRPHPVWHFSGSPDCHWQSQPEAGGPSHLLWAPFMVCLVLQEGTGQGDSLSCSRALRARLGSGNTAAGVRRDPCPQKARTLAGEANRCIWAKLRGGMFPGPSRARPGSAPPQASAREVTAASVLTTGPLGAGPLNQHALLGGRPLDPPHLSRFTEELWGHVQIGGWGPPGAGSQGCGWRQVRSQLVDGAHWVCGEGYSAERGGGCGRGRAGEGCGSGCGGRAERRGGGWAWKGRGYTRQGHPMPGAPPWCAQAWGPLHSSIFPEVGGYPGPPGSGRSPLASLCPQDHVKHQKAVEIHLSVA